MSFPYKIEYVGLKKNENRELIRWACSIVFLVIANWLWAFHDFYHWDAKCAIFLKTYSNWHFVKSVMVFFFVMSLIVLPRRHLLINLGCWLAIRWASFEFFCNYASMSRVYKGCDDWTSLLTLSKFEATVLALAVLGVRELLLFRIERKEKNIRDESGIGFS